MEYTWTGIIRVKRKNVKNIVLIKDFI